MELDKDGFIKAAEDKGSTIENAATPIEMSGEPPKKRRGRPPKNPELTKESPATGAEGPKRGRPKKRVIYDDTKKQLLAKQILGLHLIAAQLSGFNELQISEVESVMLTESIVVVSEEYGLSLDGKTGAAIQLAGTAAMIYLPRFLAIQKRKKSVSVREVKTDESNQGKVILNVPTTVN